MSKFKVGDKVRCIDKGTSMAVNRSYRISGTSSYGNFSVVDLNGNMVDGFWSSNRFEKVIHNRKKR
jgi:hypothetical protein